MRITLGEVKIILRSHGQADCSFKAGDRIAQLIREKIGDADVRGTDSLNGFTG